jgi:hypothetical protein
MVGTPSHFQRGKFRTELNLELNNRWDILCILPIHDSFNDAASNYLYHTERVVNKQCGGMWKETMVVN